MNRHFELLPDHRPPASLVDHLGVQLDLVAKILAAWDRENFGDESKLWTILTQFNKDHLQWCNQFLSRVTEQAETDFYRGLANVTTEILTTFEDKK